MSDLREDLKAYLDGELSSADAERMRAEIESNPELRKEADDMQILGAILRDEVVQPRSVGLEETLIALAGGPKKPARAWWFWPVRVVAAGMAATIVAIPLMRQESFVSDRGATYKEGVASGAVASSMASETASPPTEEAKVRYKARELGGDPESTVERIRVDQSAPAPSQRPLMALDGATRSSQSPPMMPGTGVGSGRVAAGPMFTGPLPTVADSADVRPLSPEPPVAFDAPVSESIRVVAQRFGARIVAAGNSIAVLVDAKSAAELQKSLTAAVGAAGTVKLEPAESRQLKDSGENMSQERSRGGPGGMGGGSAAPGSNSATKTNSVQQNSFANSNAQSMQMATAPPTLADLKEDLTLKEAERVRLVTEFYEDSKPVKEVDAEIARLKREIRVAEEVAKRKPSANERLIRITLKSPPPKS